MTATLKTFEGSNHGTLQGGAEFTAGKVGQAFRVGGASGSVTFPGDGTLNITGNQVTIDAWIKLEDNPTPDQRFTGVIGKNSFPDGQPYQVVFESGPVGGNPGNTLPPNQWQFEYILTNESGGRFHDQGTNVIVTVDGEYHHFAMTYDGALVQLYVDGVLRHTNGFGGNLIAAPTVPVMIWWPLSVLRRRGRNLRPRSHTIGSPVALRRRERGKMQAHADTYSHSHADTHPTPTPTPTNADTYSNTDTDPTPTPSPTPTPCVPGTFIFEGNSATSGTAGNIRKFTVSGVTVKVSAFNRVDGNGRMEPRLTSACIARD